MLHSESIAKLVLRLNIGILMLYHGMAKISDPTSVEYIGERLNDINLPELLAYGVYFGEVLAPILLIIGLYTRTAAFIVAINMVFAIMLFHAHHLISLNEFGGWALELQSFYFITAIIIFLQGSGKFAVRPS